jgi:hypothetical protein
VPGLPQRHSPEQQRADAFQDPLERGVAAGRLVQVRADVASRATDVLAAAFGIQAISSSSGTQLSADAFLMTAHVNGLPVP